MRRVAALWIVFVLVLAHGSVATATMPPPPLRFGGEWSRPEASPCRPPMPVWMMVAGC